MTLIELEKYFGTSYNFNKVTGMSHNNWANWRKMGYIPINSQRIIQRLTKNKLRARLKDLPDA